MKKVTNKEIAARIDAHLRRFEADPEINVLRTQEGVRRFYNAQAMAWGRWVNVMYVSYQGWSALSQADALAYLAWLDEGMVGRHHEAKRSDNSQSTVQEESK